MTYKIIFFGLGSIGIKHAGILQKLGHELIAYRSGNALGNSLGIREIRKWNEVKKESPDIAFITNPTYLHTETALKCAKLGMHLFIEKPLSNNMKSIDRLESLCRQNGLTCYTAYCLRFHPVINKIRKLVKNKNIYHARICASSYLPDWRPGESLKKSYRSYYGKGGGVILELSHEFDYVQYIFGRIGSIKGSYGCLSGLTVDAEDFADALLTMEDGTTVNVHLDCLSRAKERSIKIDFKDGYILGDLIGGTVEYLYKGKKKTFRFKTDRNYYLKKQIGFFLDNIGSTKIMNGITESTALLKKILEYRNG